MFVPDDIVCITADRHAGEHTDIDLIGREGICHGYVEPTAAGDAWMLGVSVAVSPEEHPNRGRRRAFSLDERDLELTGRTAGYPVPAHRWRRGVEYGEELRMRLATPSLDGGGPKALASRLVDELQTLLPGAEVRTRIERDDDDLNEVGVNVRSADLSALSMSAAILERWPTTYYWVHDTGWVVSFLWHATGVARMTDGLVAGEPGALIDQAVTSADLMTYSWRSPARRRANLPVNARAVRDCLRGRGGVRIGDALPGETVTTGPDGGCLKVSLTGGDALAGTIPTSSAF